MKYLKGLISLCLVAVCLIILPSIVRAESVRTIAGGTYGDHISWELSEDGTLTISGKGAIAGQHSGMMMPWYSHWETITSVVVKDGITEIPAYTFEYLENVKTIELPDTLTALTLNAFNDCGSLNNLLLPASLTNIYGWSNTGNPAFIRCESLSNVYYLGTEEEWLALPNASTVTNAYAEMTWHFLQLHEDPATCTENGIQSYYAFDEPTVYGDLYDLNKNKIKEPELLEATGHDLSVWHVVTEASCTANGLTQRECANCDYYETGTINAKGHNYYEVVIPPGCTAEGYTAHTCIRCDDSYVDTYVDPIGHAYSAWTVMQAPTCTAMGIEYRDCSNCYDSETREVAAKGHSYSYEVTTAAACEKDGVVTYTCQNCTKSYTEAIKALGHDYQNGQCTRCKAKDPNYIGENEPQITVSANTARAGEEVTVVIGLKNNPGIASLKLNVEYDAALTLQTVTYNSEIGGQFQPPQNLDSPVTLNWLDFTGNAEGDWVFATLTFLVSEDAKANDQLKLTITYDQDDVYGYDGEFTEQVIPFAVQDCFVEVASYLPGDINGDGKVNNRDASRLFQYLSGWDVEVVEAALDVNGDGKVNNRDASRLFQYLSGWDVEIF